MGILRRGKKRDGLDKIHLTDDFRELERAEAPYPAPQDGIEVTGENLRILLEEFCQSQRSLLHLYLPREDREESRDFLIQERDRKSLHILDISIDQESADFLRNHALARFGFEHRNYTYVFETKVLGRIEGEEPLFLALKPETIFQERRSHQRYTLWPYHKAFFKEMAVMDISQKGIRIFSEQDLNSPEVLEDSKLILPPVYDVITNDCYYSGGEIEVPRAVVTNELKHGKGHYYGLYFDQEWPSEQTKTLNDFILGLRKRIFYAGGE